MTESLRRRDFLAATSATIAGTLLATQTRTSIAAEPAKRQPICVFTKPFNSLSFDELADAIAEAGFDGIEAPIRAGGHVEPASVADELPKLHEALAKRGLEITILTTDVNDPTDPLSELLLRTAATLGIGRYRMKYFRYDMGKSPEPQIASWRDQMRDLAELNHQFGVQGLYQNHAGGDYFGAAIWDLHLGLADIGKEKIGVAYDVRHAIAEAGMSWQVGLNLIRDKIAAMYVKDFRWNGDQTVNVPLGEGRVNQSAIGQLKLKTFDGPISLHEEYLDHTKPELVPKHLTAIAKDLKTLEGWM